MSLGGVLIDTSVWKEPGEERENVISAVQNQYRTLNTGLMTIDVQIRAESKKPHRREG